VTSAGVLALIAGRSLNPLNAATGHDVKHDAELAVSSVADNRCANH